jgi:DNA-binding XRE family transcriptional regulator
MAEGISGAFVVGLNYQQLSSRTAMPAKLDTLDAPKLASMQSINSAICGISKQPTKKRDKAIGEQVRFYRKRLDLSQEDLGSLVGLTNSVVSRIESGERSLLLSEVWVFASSLQVNPIIFLLPCEPSKQTWALLN